MSACESERHSVLGGKVGLHQSKVVGHRAGLDAVMLAAAVVPSDRDKPYHVMDLGAGIGTAGLCVAARFDNALVTLVENDGDVFKLCEKTCNDPTNQAFRDRLHLLQADVSASAKIREEAGMVPNRTDHVIMNPPYWDEGSVRISPHEKKASAHILGKRGLDPWFRTAVSLLKPGGRLSVIFPASRLETVLQNMQGRFGGVTIFPLYKGEDEPASRVIVQGVKASRAQLRLLPGLVLHEPVGANKGRRPYTAITEQILNGEAGLRI